ncbi:ABC transporter permease [Rhizohabitans arisaemae]|uniref:ABC transporter permease n=1 Tax=Rhizohabitans arisaemae TaxID=2720610 RepID=UPI0024B1CE37|nr:ABC transporter permease [Rhizohabitans arisaemae]
MSTTRASLRWIRADVKARRGQAGLAACVVAGVVTALIMAATLLEDGTNPWRGLFAQSRGAHVWIHTVGVADPSAALARLDQVTAVAGPYRTAPATLLQGFVKSGVTLRAMGFTPPEVARPLIREGRWLDPANPTGVVVERSFARATRLVVGGHFPVRGVDGVTHDLTVAGIADTSDQGFYPERQPGLVWAPADTVRQVDPVSRLSVTGLLLEDPEDAELVVQRAVTVLGGEVERAFTWRGIQAEMELDNRLLGLLLALFGIVGLVAAGLAIANATGGQVLGRLHDIAVLKSLGFTRGQVTRMLLAEHAAVGLAGVAAGVLIARLLTVSVFADTVAVPLSLAPLLAITGGTVLTVVVATLIPAWRGGRTPALPAVPVAPPHGRLSRLARVALLVRLPPALVLGARDAFTRRVPAALTTFGLAVPMMMITIGLGCWATLDGFRDNPEQVGQAAALTVRPGILSSAEAKRIAESDPAVAEVYPGADVEVFVPGQNRTVTTRAVGTSRRPYPFPVVEGRMFARHGEAVAGQGLLDLIRQRIGDRIRVTVGGSTVILRIVGRTIEPERDGEVLSLGIDSLAGKDADPPEFYSLVLRPGADPAEVRTRLLAASRNGLDVQRVVNPAERLEVVRPVIVALIAVLALIALANLLTASAIGLRDHKRDLGVLKAMGLTPRQITATLVVGTGLLALIAVVTGTVAGAVLSAELIDLQGRTSGVGAGIGRTPDPVTLVGAALTALAATTLTALVPARRAARAQIAAAVRS